MREHACTSETIFGEWGDGGRATREIPQLQMIVPAAVRDQVQGIGFGL